MNESCAGCRYWFLIRPSGETSSDWAGRFGKCRRGSPVLVAEDSIPPDLAVWPTTQAEDWCGEWRERVEE